MSNDENPSGRGLLSSSGTRPSGRTAPASNLSGGTLVGDRYRLKERLGEGGMGEVWLAHNETLDIDVAVKVIRASEDNREEYTDRLLNEARAAARLGHPAIVRVNDFGKTQSGEPYIVMELLEGEDLADTLAKRGRLSAIEAVQTILPIAHALTMAHSKGIVHRDIKPENIFLAQSEGGVVQPKLVDFGVAKLEITQSIRPTQTGSMLGSPLYMSPEQARGDEIGHRSDIWSLAVVLYETIAGRPPFEGKNYNSVLYSIVANPIVPLTERGSDDSELWIILERALQKDPDRRWYSMRDFGEALATWLVDKNVGEDRAGASIQNSWFQWNRQSEELAAGPATAGASAPALGDIPPPPTLPTRSRQVTVRTHRTNRKVRWVIGAAALAVAAVAAIALALRGVPEETGVQDDNAPSIATVKPSVQVRSEGTPDDSEMMESSEGVVVWDDPLPTSEEPALAPSALPVAEEEAPARRARPIRPTRPTEKPPAPPPASEQAPSKKEIVTRDPY